MNFTTSETQKYNNTADWAATKREVEKNGEYKLVVHSTQDFTQDNLRTSLANSAAVLIVGDTGGIPDIKRGTYTAVEIVLADGAIITSNGYGRLAPTAAENPETGLIERGVIALTVLPQNNTEATGIFACNAASVASGLNSNGQNVVANTGGPDGLTSAPALVSSAQSFARTFSTTGSVGAATNAANSVLRQSQGHGALHVPEFPQIPYNDRGDRLVPIPKPGQQ